MDFTNKEWAGLGMYIGYKASYRREEMAYRGIDYDAVQAKLVEVGLIKGRGIDMKRARAIWESKFGKTLPSQVHQYLPQLGVEGHRFK